MKKILIYMGLLLGLCMLGGCSFNSTSSSNENQKITISAAASLKGALTDIIAAYKEEKGLQDNQITVNFAGSGTLRQQIEQGAPVALFISADQDNMKSLEEKGLVVQVTPLVTNSLVLIVPKGHAPLTLQNLGQVKRLALGEVARVPAGKYGQQFLSQADLWGRLEQQIVYAKDVKAVTAYVSQGAVDGGIVYKTDALAAKDSVDITADVPDQSHDSIVYPMGLVFKYNNDLSRDFYTYLKSSKAQDILKAYGFKIPIS